MTGIIYKCVCTITSKCYIGQTIQTLNKRKSSHLKDSLNPNSKGYNYYFHKAIR